MITGVVTPELEAVLNVRLQSAGGRPETVPAVIDTGFDGFIALPSDLIAQMQLTGMFVVPTLVGHCFEKEPH